MYIWMAAAFIIVVLIWVIYRSKREGLMYNYRQNTSSNDPDDQYTENIRVRECLRRCDREPRCKRLMTDKLNDDATAKCWFKSTDTDPGGTGTAMHLFTKIPDLPKAPEYIIKNNTSPLAGSGNELGKLNVLPDECKYWCDTLDACTHYVTKGNECILKGNVRGKLTPGSVSGSILNYKAPSGICEGDNKFAIKKNKDTDCAVELSKVDEEDSDPKASTYTDYHYGMNIGGDTMQPQYNNSNPEDCRRQCNERPGCVAFVMEGSGATNTECHLKNHLTPLIEAWNWRTQYKAPFGLCNKDKEIARVDAAGTNCNKKFDFTNEGIDYPGNDIFNFSGRDINYCEKACKNTPNCNTITFKKDPPYEVAMYGRVRTITPTTGVCFLKSGRGQEREDAAYFSKSYIDYGKCWNGVTAKNDEKGTNCPPVCPDGKTVKVGNGNNCPEMCADGKTVKYGDGANCAYIFTPLINGWFPGTVAGQPGADLEYFPDTTKGACMAVCKSTPDCGGIEIKDKQCWVKDKGMIKRRNGSVTATSYLLAPYGLCADKKIPKLDAAGSNCRMEMLPVKPKISIEGNDMFDYTNSSVTDCFNTCKSTAGCKAFVMDTAAGTHCHIKNDITNQEENDAYDTYEVAPFGLCANKTSKLDSIGTNCPDFVTPTNAPIPTGTPTPATTPPSGLISATTPPDDGIYTDYPTDLTIGCPGNRDITYCNKQSDNTAAPEPDNASAPEFENPTPDPEKWEFSKYLRKFFLHEKIMGNEN